MEGKTALVYYSLEGNTAFIAKMVKDLIGARVIRLKPEKEPPRKGAWKMLIGGFTALTHKKPRLAPIHTNLSEYDNIILAYPVWAGTYPPAIGSFLEEYSLYGRKVYLIANSGSGNEGKSFEQIEGAIYDSEITDAICLATPLKNRKKVRDELEMFLR